VNEDNFVYDRNLSPQMERVLRLAAEGWLSTQIAVELGITISAVEKYLSEIRSRLNAKTTTQSVFKGVLNGSLVLRPDEINLIMEWQTLRLRNYCTFDLSGLK
jgi:DNA-binding CsgD family transcriptional regulator